jgi:2-aminoadipate transaminase
MSWHKLYTDRVNNMSPSIIQEMKDLVSRPGTVSFTAGEPSPELFPIGGLKAAFEKVLNGYPELLSYAPPAGDPVLRSWISSWLQQRGYVEKDPGPERILLTNGSQAALGILALMFFQKGTAIVVENPSYTEAMLTFRKEGCTLLPVDMDNEGPLPDDFEKLAREKKPSFFYTIPTFQNPSGITTSEERKKDILEIAERYGIRIIEDDPYRELWYDSPPPATYIALSSESGNIIYLGSFSKIIAPGLRCGFALLPDEIMGKAVDMRVLMEIGLSSLTQRALFEFLVNADLDSYLGSIRDVYRNRRDKMISAMKNYFEPESLLFEVPMGGFFIWGRLPGTDCTDFARFAALEEKVGAIPGSGFFEDPGEGREFLRFSFAQVDGDTSWEGIIRLSRALEKYKNRK